MPASLRGALKATAREVPKHILKAFGDDFKDDSKWLRIKA